MQGKDFITSLPSPVIGGKKHPSTFIDLLVDGNFKLVFTKESSKPVLVGLLNELLPGLHIRSIELKPQEMRPRRKELRTSIFDAYCTTDDGRRIVIEVQYNSRKDYLDRMLYYSTWPISEQKRVSEKNYRLDAVYILSFCNFALGHDKDWDESGTKIASSYSIREDDNGEKMTDALHFVYLELERFTKGVDELEDARDELLWYLKNAGKVDSIPFSSRHTVVQALHDLLTVASLSPEEHTQYEANMKNDFDIRTEKLLLKEESYRQGVAEGEALGEQRGIAKGRAEGMTEGKSEVARAMLSENVPIDLVCKFTGLSKAQLSAL